LRLRAVFVLLAVALAAGVAVSAVLVDVWRVRSRVRVGHPSLRLVLDDGSPLTEHDWGVFSYEGESKTLSFSLSVVGTETVQIYWDVSGLPSCFRLEVFKNGDPWAQGECVAKRPGETFVVMVRLTLTEYVEGDYEFELVFYAEPKQ